MAETLLRPTCTLTLTVCYCLQEQIGVLTSMPLLNNVLSDLRASEDARGMCSLYFTKESHIHTLLNLVLSSNLPIVMPQMPPLDYFSSITFEVYERTSTSTYGVGAYSAPQSPRTGSGFNAPNTQRSAQSTPALGPSAGPEMPNEELDDTTPGLTGAPRLRAQGSAQASSIRTGGGGSGGATKPKPERSLLITVSEGAHSSNILSINLDARHALAPLPRRPLTSHMDFDEALQKLGAHTLVGDTGRGQIEGDAVYFGREEADRHLLPVETKTRRGSLDTDGSSIRAALQT